MAQAVLSIEGLPESGLDASAAFHAEHMARAREALEKVETTSLVIVLPAAGPDHDDWRRTLARDLSRAYPTVRVNVVGGDDEDAVAEILAYLKGAPGVTGQYCAAHE